MARDFQKRTRADNVIQLLISSAIIIRYGLTAPVRVENVRRVNILS